MMLTGALAACGSPAVQAPGSTGAAAGPTATAEAASAVAARPAAASAAAASAVAASAVAVGAPSARGAVAGAAGNESVPSFSHVFVIVLENHGLDDVLGSGQAPNLTSLAKQGAVAANYYGVAHPSEPNYLALIGGDTFGVTSDATSTRIDAPTIVDQLQAAGRTWKAYMEDLPAPGSLTTGSGGYAKKHDPFVLFSTVTASPARLRQVVPLTELPADLKNGAPDFSFIVPNMCHDMHDCSIAAGDAFIGPLLTALRSSAAWDAHAAAFIVFDEDDDGDSNATCCGTQPGGGLTGAIVLSPLTRPGSVSRAPFNHYSLLRTIEDAWKLPLLRHAGNAAVQPMTGLFAAGR